MISKPIHAYLTGEVVKGRQLGRTLGFPTANLRCFDMIEGLDMGVYAARVSYKGQVYDAVVNIGTAPTVTTSSSAHIEAHLFDFSEDLYGARISIELVAFLRAEQQFPSIEALQAQIYSDAQNARDLLATLS